MRTQVAEDLADLFELDPGVDQLLDRLEFEQIGVGVPASAPAAGGVGERRTDQIGPGPVVELTVRDSDDLCGLRTAVADLVREICIDHLNHGCLPRLFCPTFVNERRSATPSPPIGHTNVTTTL